jgi:hypothetical protein
MEPSATSCGARRRPVAAGIGDFGKFSQFQSQVRLKSVPHGEWSPMCTIRFGAISSHVVAAPGERDQRSHGGVGVARCRLLGLRAG